MRQEWGEARLINRHSVGIVLLPPPCAPIVRAAINHEIRIGGTGRRRADAILPPPEKRCTIPPESTGMSPIFSDIMGSLAGAERGGYAGGGSRCSGTR